MLNMMQDAAARGNLDKQQLQDLEKRRKQLQGSKAIAKAPAGSSAGSSGGAAGRSLANHTMHPTFMDSEVQEIDDEQPVPEQHAQAAAGAVDVRTSHEQAQGSKRVMQASPLCCGCQPPQQ
jgi:hypothetical protein